MTRPVVVGIDDLEHSARAVAAAAREARLRGAPLWLSHTYHWLPPGAAGLTPGADTPRLPTARESGVRCAVPDHVPLVVTGLDGDMTVMNGGPVPIETTGPGSNAPASRTAKTAAEDDTPAWRSS